MNDFEQARGRDEVSKMTTGSRQRIVDSPKGIDVYLWDKLLGKIANDPHRESWAFRYSDEFRETGIQPSPLAMPTSLSETYYIEDSRSPTFLGLPGLISDSLPDQFGRRLFNHWWKGLQVPPNPRYTLFMLAFMNSRAMGALTFRPRRGEIRKARPIHLPTLVDQCVRLDEVKDVSKENFDELIHVGAFAGGARPKAVVCWNPRSGDLRTGQGEAPEGFEHWLLKFDLGGTSSMLGRIEYAYHLMARAAGIHMEDCRLLEEGGRAHFMTRRFDRGPQNARHHIQTLCAMDYMDYRMCPYFAYGQFFNVIQRLNLPYQDLEEAFRRMVFNVMARNQDDHTKNHAFRLRQGASWELAPAYDLTFVSGPGIRHQMSVNHKLQDLTRQDLLAEAKRFSIAGKPTLDQVRAALLRWPEFAGMAGLSEETTATIAGQFQAL